MKNLFADVCFKDGTTSTASTTTERQSSKIKTLPLNFNTTTRIDTTAARITASSTPQSSTTLTSKIIQEIIEKAPPMQETNVSESKTTEAQKDYEDVGINVEGEDEHDVELDDVFPPTTTYGSNSIVNERFMMKTKSQGADVSLIIKTSVIVVSTIIFSLFIFLIIYKQYKKSTNPLNYKEKQENDSRMAHEQFSEIRFLTCDETLDFNLATF